GRIRFAAIDADIFRDAATGAVSGPLAPYLPLVERHAGRLLVLPHAVADTDHPSRVAGAKQAVDQILEAIRFRRVGNLKGDLPDGYTAVPGRAIHGIGGVSAGTLAGVAEDADVVKQFADMAGRLHDFWTRLAAAADAEERQALCAAMGDGVMLDVNRQAALIGALGLHGPFTGKPRD
ncbi:MAG: NAD(P)-dependent oxidoreductase, partial [Aestuariivirga sp.]